MFRSDLVETVGLFFNADMRREVREMYEVLVQMILECRAVDFQSEVFFSKKFQG